MKKKTTQFSISRGLLASWGQLWPEAENGASGGRQGRQGPGPAAQTPNAWVGVTRSTCGGRLGYSSTRVRTKGPDLQGSKPHVHLGGEGDLLMGMRSVRSHYLERGWSKKRGQRKELTGTAQHHLSDPGTPLLTTHGPDMVTWSQPTSRWSGSGVGQKYLENSMVAAIHGDQFGAFLWRPPSMCLHILMYVPRAPLIQHA